MSSNKQHGQYPSDTTLVRPGLTLRPCSLGSSGLVWHAAIICARALGPPSQTARRTQRSRHILMNCEMTLAFACWTSTWMRMRRVKAPTSGPSPMFFFVSSALGQPPSGEDEVGVRTLGAVGWGVDAVLGVPRGLPHRSSLRLRRARPQAKPVAPTPGPRWRARRRAAQTSPAASPMARRRAGLASRRFRAARAKPSRLSQHSVARGKLASLVVRPQGRDRRAAPLRFGAPDEVPRQARGRHARCAVRSARTPGERRRGHEVGRFSRGVRSREPLELRCMLRRICMRAAVGAIR